MKYVKILSDDQPESKGIYQDSKTGRLGLFFYYPTDDKSKSDLREATWKEFKNSKLKDTSSDRLKKEFVYSLLNQFKQFNKKVDFNTWSKKGNPSFEEKVDWLLKNGAKYTKSGIKNYNIAV